MRVCCSERRLYVNYLGFLIASTSNIAQQKLYCFKHHIFFTIGDSHFCNTLCNISSVRARHLNCSLAKIISCATKGLHHGRS